MRQKAPRDVSISSNFTGWYLEPPHEREGASDIHPKHGLRLSLAGRLLGKIPHKDYTILPYEKLGVANIQEPFNSYYGPARRELVVHLNDSTHPRSGNELSKFIERIQPNGHCSRALY